MLLGGPHYVLLMDKARKRALSLLLNEILISYSFNPGKLYWDGNHKSCHFVFLFHLRYGSHFQDSFHKFPNEIPASEKILFTP